MTPPKFKGTDLAVATSSEMDSNMAPCTPKDKKKKKEKRRSKEPSPEAIKATEAPSSEIVVNPAMVSEQSLSAGVLFRLSLQNSEQNDLARRIQQPILKLQIFEFSQIS